MTQRRLIRTTLPALMALAVALLLALGAAPSTGAQAFDMEAVERGRLVYDVTAGGVGCAMCHAPFATGDIGPDIRGMTARDVSDSLDLIPDMSFIALSDADLEDVGAFLGWLGAYTPQLVGMTGGAFRSPEVSVKVGVPVQLIFDSADRGAEYVLSSDLWAEPVTVPSAGAGAAEMTPEAAGSFVVTCEGCADGATLTINVTD